MSTTYNAGAFKQPSRFKRFIHNKDSCFILKLWVIYMLIAITTILTTTCIFTNLCEAGGVSKGFTLALGAPSLLTVGPSPTMSPVPTQMHQLFSEGTNYIAPAFAYGCENWHCRGTPGIDVHCMCLPAISTPNG